MAVSWGEDKSKRRGEINEEKLREKARSPAGSTDFLVNVGFYLGRKNHLYYSAQSSGNGFIVRSYVLTAPGSLGMQFVLFISRGTHSGWKQ